MRGAVGSSDTRRLGMARGQGTDARSRQSSKGTPKGLALTSPGVMLVPAPQEEDHPKQLTSLEACVGWPWIPPTKPQAGDQGHEHHEQTMLRPVLISRVSSFLMHDLQERVLHGSLTCCWPPCVNTDTGGTLTAPALAQTSQPPPLQPFSTQPSPPTSSLGFPSQTGGMCCWCCLSGFALESAGERAQPSRVRLCTESHGAGPGLSIKLQLGSHCQLWFSLRSLLFQMIISG